MHSFHFKRNDEVVVLAGAEKGKRGKVIAVDGKKQRCIVEGVRMIKKHKRKSQDFPQGRIVEQEGYLHISNVMKADQYDARMAKHGAAPAQPAQ